MVITQLSIEQIIESRMKDIRNQCINDIIWEEYEGKILSLAEKIAEEKNREGNRRIYELEKELRSAYEEIERLKQEIEFAQPRTIGKIEKTLIERI